MLEGVCRTLVAMTLPAVAFAASPDAPSTEAATVDAAPETGPIHDVADMSMQDLLNIKVESASRVLERVSDAPASITAYTDEDLRNLGTWTLSQLADITPGYSSTIMFGERIFETRGQMAGSF